MKLAIMQPYFLPYLGYFQLIASVNKFVVYDDVSFIKGGWINRNNIKVQGRSNLITVPLHNGRSGVPIREVLIVRERESWSKKMLRTVSETYAKAPFYDDIYPKFENWINHGFKSIAELNVHIICDICKYLNISTQISKTSSIYDNLELASEQRILDICNKEHASQYINAIGGRGLYSNKAFKEKGITLNFLQPSLSPYTQGKGEFVPGLSILDILMHLGAEGARAQLNQYKLL